MCIGINTRKKDICFFVFNRDMVRFCESVHAFLSEDDDNIVAVHCKGGKGRTGTLICTWLVECGKFEEAQVRL